MLPIDTDFGDADEKLIRRIYSQYKSSAKRRKLEFTIPLPIFGEMVLQNCAYCGAPPSNLKKGKGGKAQPYNGLDRKDSTLGYRRENCVPCCSFCNSIKAAMPMSDWADFLNGVVRLYGGTEPYPGVVSAERAGKSFYFNRRKSRK